MSNATIQKAVLIEHPQTYRATRAQKTRYAAEIVFGLQFEAKDWNERYNVFYTTCVCIL